MNYKLDPSTILYISEFSYYAAYFLHQPLIICIPKQLHAIKFSLKRNVTVIDSHNQAIRDSSHFTQHERYKYFETISLLLQSKYTLISTERHDPILM